MVGFRGEETIMGVDAVPDEKSNFLTVSTDLIWYPSEIAIALISKNGQGYAQIY